MTSFPKRKMFPYDTFKVTSNIVFPLFELAVGPLGVCPTKQLILDGIFPKTVHFVFPKSEELFDHANRNVLLSHLMHLFLIQINRDDPFLSFASFDPLLDLRCEESGGPSGRNKPQVHPPREKSLFRVSYRGFIAEFSHNSK